MRQDNFTTSFTVKQTPEVAFASITDPRAWWSGTFEGDARHFGDVFTYRYQNFHFSKQRVTELIPGKRVAWEVLESELSFLQDKAEWTGTALTFDIEPSGEMTKVTFTHVGLKPVVECYETCTNAWTSLIQGSLRQLIETGNTSHIELAAPAR